MTSPMPCHTPRWVWGEERNHPRVTTSWYIAPWMRLRVLAKVFFSSERRTTSPRVEKMPSSSWRS